VKALLVTAAISALLLAGCDRHGSVPDAAKPLAHFWFDYNSQPHPGKRVWVRLNETTWVVLYPNGVQARYRTKGREEVRGLRGTVVEKFEGDPNETGTPNDGSFQIFIPDRDNQQLLLSFRHFQNGAWQPWQPLAPVIPIE